MKRTLLIVALVLMAGCASTQPRDTADLAGIEEIVLALPDAWNARDAGAWVGRFTEESGFTNITARVLRIRPVGEAGVVAEVELTLVGHARLPPDVVETAPGVLRTRLMTVLERRDGQWWVVAAQNTAILPVAAR